MAKHLIKNYLLLEPGDIALNLISKCNTADVAKHVIQNYLLLEPGDIAVKIDAVLPCSVGILPDPLGQLAEVRSLLGLQISLQQQLRMKCPLKVLHDMHTRTISETSILVSPLRSFAYRH